MKIENIRTKNPGIIKITIMWAAFAAVTIVATFLMLFFIRSNEEALK